MMFADSDVYKLMEAMAWEVGRSGSSDADERIRGLTEIIGSAQEADGYLNTVFGRPGQEPRYSDLEWGTSCTTSATFSRPAWRGVATTGDDGSSRSPVAPPTMSVRRSAPVASSASADTPRSRWGWSSWPA